MAREKLAITSACIALYYSIQLMQQRRLTCILGLDEKHDVDVTWRPIVKIPNLVRQHSSSFLHRIACTQRIDATYCYRFRTYLTWAEDAGTESGGWLYQKQQICQICEVPAAVRMSFIIFSREVSVVARPVSGLESWVLPDARTGNDSRPNISPICREAPTGAIALNFGMHGSVVDIIIRAKFCDSRFMVFGVLIP